MNSRSFVALVIFTLSTSVQALTFNTVVIDPGHGGRDGGCVWNGLIEKKLCLDTALRLEKILKARGLRVVMTRRTDVDVDLDRRAVIANNAARRPKHLWTEQIGGELITRYHAEDEHDEAAVTHKTFGEHVRLDRKSVV